MEDTKSLSSFYTSVFSGLFLDIKSPWIFPLAVHRDTGSKLNGGWGWELQAVAHKA